MDTNSKYPWNLELRVKSGNVVRTGGKYDHVCTKLHESYRQLSRDQWPQIDLSHKDLAPTWNNVQNCEGYVTTQFEMERSENQKK